jgi:AcrR family transcriptional regulator
MNCSVLKALQPRWERRKEARPAELLAAALAVFVEKGFAGARLEEVAARAGVSKGTLYLYFRSKEDLFEAVVREFVVRRADDERLRLAGSGGDPRQRLQAALEGLWQFFGDAAASGLVKLIISEARNFPATARFYMDEVVRPTHEFLGGTIREGVAAGHFRPVEVESFVQVLMAPLLTLALWRHSLIACCVMEVDIEAYRATHCSMVLGALSPLPAPLSASPSPPLSPPPPMRQSDGIAA